MTVKELKEILKDIPDNAIVYCESDHGQNGNQANYVNLTKDKDLEWFTEDMDFESVIKNKAKVTGVLIS